MTEVAAGHGDGAASVTAGGTGTAGGTAGGAAAEHVHGGGHGAGHGIDPGAESDAPVEYDQAFWDQRYAASDSIWSGNPNPVLVAETSTLLAGKALDIGSGEGADAIWLAGQGWEVTAVDISVVALAKAAERAAVLGDSANRIAWEQHDLTAWAPPTACFDLVSAQFMHLPLAQRQVLFADLAASVAAGGTLLIVGHDMVDLDVAHRWNIPGMFYSADELAATLDPDQWSIDVAESRARDAVVPETLAGEPAPGGAEAGATITVHDVVLRARRR